MAGFGWDRLAANLGLGAVLVILWMHFLETAPSLRPWTKRLLFGAVMGMAAVTSMLLPVEVAPGLILDLRGVFLTLAAFFGGPVVGVIAAAPALLYRIHVGGVGMWAGCSSIVVMTALGALGHRLCRDRQPGYRELALLAAVVSLAGVAVRFLLVPGSAPPSLREFDVLYPLMYAAGIFALGLGFAEAQRRNAHDRIQALYRAMVEALPDCLNVKDLEGRFLLANPATARLVGVATPDDLLGRTDADFFPGSIAAQFRAEEEACLAQGEPVVIDQALPAPNGESRWVTTLKAPFRTPDGQTAGVITHNRDATEARQLQRLLKSTNEKLDDAIAAMADGIALYDAEGTLVLCNHRYQEMFPKTADLRVPGIRFEDLMRAAALRGEFRNEPNTDLEAWVAERVANLRTSGQREFELTDGRFIQVRKRPTREGGGLLVVSDITERKKVERELEHRATHDTLTGLANRSVFQEQLRCRRARAEQEDTYLAVLLIDLDRFKEVNDTYGHVVGDGLVVEMARRLRAVVREKDLVARLGGDEFAILASGRTSEFGQRLAQRVVEVLADPYQAGEFEVRPSGTVGLTIYPDDPSGPQQLLVNADRALYAGKQAGRAMWIPFQPDMRETRSGKEPLGTEILRAVEQGQLDIDLQPIVTLDTLEVVGAEALVRWNHPQHGRLSALAFIGAAERGPAILPLTRFVLRRALEAQRGWYDQGLGDLQILVNLAPRCLAWEGLVDAVAMTLNDVTIRPQRLVLEITESTIVAITTAEARLAALRLLGVGVAIDDFGAGYSSLARLKALPIDMLKIDRAFVTEIVEDERDAAITEMIITLGQKLGLTITAEGVETREQLTKLRRLGCKRAQGNLFARPMPAAQFEGWLRSWQEGRNRADPGADLLRMTSEGT